MSSAVTTVTAWSLTAFGMSEFFTSDPADLQLDRIHAEFGLVEKTDLGRTSMMKFLNEDPIFFNASWAIGACHSPSSAKVAVQLPNGQVDLIFASYDSAQSFLATLKSLATTAFTLHQVPGNLLSTFHRFTFDMVKAGFVTPSNQTWKAVSDPVSSTWTRLWKTGDWSDFTVVAGKKEFKVHRSVLCPQSSFFAAACRPGFLEGASGRIELEEDEATIETLLAEIYGVENAITGSVFREFALKYEIQKEFAMNTLLKLFIAADKYNLETIKNRAVEAVSDRLPLIKEPWIVVCLATLIYDHCPESDAGLRVIIVDHLQKRLPTILNDADVKAELLSHEPIMETLLQRFSAAVESGALTSTATPPPSPDQPRKPNKRVLRNNSSS